MSAIQFLWINLLSDVAPALALAVEPPEPDVMDRPPLDPQKPILDRAALGEIGRDAAILSAATLGVHGLAVARHGAGPQATTIAFCTLTAAQLVHALGYRAGYSMMGTRFPTLELTVGGTLAVHLAAMTASPLRRLLGTTPISPSDWLLVAGGVAVPLIARQLRGAFTSGTTSIQNDRAHEVTRWQPSEVRAQPRNAGRPERTASRPRRRERPRTEASKRRSSGRSAGAGPSPSAW